jgi:hypothetical protein
MWRPFLRICARQPCKQRVLVGWIHREDKFRYGTQMLGVIGETVGWQKRIKNRALQDIGIDPERLSQG